MANKSNYENKNIEGDLIVTEEKGKKVLYIRAIEGKLNGLVMKMFGLKVRKDGVLTGRCVYDPTEAKLGKIIHFGKWSIPQEARDELGMVIVTKETTNTTDQEAPATLPEDLTDLTDALPAEEPTAPVVKVAKAGKETKAKTTPKKAAKKASKKEKATVPA